jgi:uncharacterized protein (TIGR03546 family)
VIFTRSIGKVLRGKATPLQLALACILGSAVGFLPGYADGAIFLHAPGLLLTLLLALIILNANLPLAALIGGLAKLVSLAVMPLNFAVGRFLLDGPTQAYFAKAINAPVLALFGFEYYATTGALALGLVFGALAAVLVIAIVRSFRSRMARLEEGSEAFKKYASKGWVKILTFVLIGGNKGKRTYAELNAKRYGLPVRPLGIVFAALVLGLGFILNAIARDEIVTATLRRGLEQANGATVDLKHAQLDVRAGRLLVTGLAMADPEQLDTDLFRADTVEADMSTRDLLRRRIAVDLVVARDAFTGEKRAVPGRRVRAAPPAPPEPRQPGDKNLEDYLAQADAWKERLRQAKRWLDELERSTEPEGTPSEQRETLRERLAREVREKGYARVAATHLVEGAPTLYIRELLIEGLRSKPLPGQTAPEVLDVRGDHLSTHPWLVQQPARLTVRSRSDMLSFEALFAGFAPGGTSSTVALAYRGMPADLIGEQLKIKDTKPFTGGTIDFSADGTLARGGGIHLPFNVTVRNTTIAVPRLGSAPISELAVPFGVTGRLDDPRILWDQAAFADALGKAGANELAGRVRAEAQQAVDKAKAELAQKVDEKTDEFKQKAGSKLTEVAGEKLPGITERLPGLTEKIPGLTPQPPAGEGEQPEGAAPAEKPIEKIEEKVGEEIKKNLPRLLTPRRDDQKK